MGVSPPLSLARLGAFYFLFFAAVGVFMPYWTLYLESLGFSASAIGNVMALMMATRIVAPNLWSAWSDRRGRRLGVIRIGAGFALLTFAWVPFVTSPVALATLVALYAVFWSAVLPQFEALTMTQLGARRQRYGRLRAWGSVGFIVASLCFGALLERRGIELLPWFVLALLGAATAMTWLLREPKTNVGQATDGGLMATMSRPPVLGLLLAAALMQASHGPYYVFFSIYLEAEGFEPGVIGALWSLGVIAEVVMFAVLPPLLGRFALGHVFLCCFLLTTIRWLLLAWLPPTWPVLIVVQGLHAVSFGAFHAVAIALVHQQFPPRQQARGQALYSSLSFGAGGAIGSAASGWSWTTQGEAVTFAAAGAVALIGALVVWRTLLPHADADSPTTR